MKVPYLKERRRHELQQISIEFGAAISTHFSKERGEARSKSGSAVAAHSLFTLLQLLLSGPHQLNPSREFALEGAKASGNFGAFVSALSAFGAPANVAGLMQEAYAATIFSGFVRELRSDLLLALLQVQICNYRGAAIALRCALEDLYRHLFYMDHQQEYLAVREGRASEMELKISPVQLRAYLQNTSYLRTFATVNLSFQRKNTELKEMDLFGLNEQLYGDLSAAVHGTSDWFAAIENASSLKEVGPKEKLLDRLASDLCRLATAFLVAAHLPIFSSAGDYDKSIVLDALVPEERANFRRLLNV